MDVGYDGQDATEFCAWIDDRGASVIDIRYRPHTRQLGWDYEALLQRLGFQYLHCPA